MMMATIGLSARCLSLLQLLPVLVPVLLGLPGEAVAQEIWLTKLDDVVAVFSVPAGSVSALGGVNVFKVPTQYVLAAPEAELQAVLDGIRHNHLKLAVEGLMLEGQRAECGHGVEGYSAPGTMRKVAERIQHLGGTLDAVAMDEPLWFGSHYHGKQNCLDPVAVVAQQLVGSVRDILAVFPQARIGDIEPVVDVADTQWSALLASWPALYQAGVGRKLDFMHADIVWDQRWQASLTQTDKAMHEANVPFGIIYTGDGDAPTAADWTASAEMHFGIIEDELGVVPQQVIFQSWEPQVAHLLPESEPGSLLSLLDRYQLPHPKLRASRQPDQIVGDLRDMHGLAQPHRQIRLAVVGGVPAAPAPMHLAGMVPAAARKAILAVRLNTECACSGEAQLEIDAAVYRERSSAHETKPALPMAPNAAVVGRFQVSAGTKVAANAAAFSVTPNVPFDLDLTVEASSGAGNVGFIAIIFLDETGKEARRFTILLGHEKREVAQAVTDDEGHFVLRHDLRGARKWVVTAPGDTQHRSAALVIPGG